MPYIIPDKRALLDGPIAEVLNALRELECDDPGNSTAGNLNYVFTRVLDSVYNTPRYNDINESIGVLECCKLELYRRIAVPYEIQKCHDNGDAYEPMVLMAREF